MMIYVRKNNYFDGYDVNHKTYVIVDKDNGYILKSFDDCNVALCEAEKMGDEGYFFNQAISVPSL